MTQHWVRMCKSLIISFPGVRNGLKGVLLLVCFLLVFVFWWLWGHCIESGSGIEGNSG